MSARNTALGELLAIFDAVRGGSARERTRAVPLRNSLRLWVSNWCSWVERSQAL